MSDIRNCGGIQKLLTIWNKVTRKTNRAKFSVRKCSQEDQRGIAASGFGILVWMMYVDYD
jgi:hypothetical protein